MNTIGKEEADDIQPTGSRPALPPPLDAPDLPRVPQQERGRRKRAALLAAGADLFGRRGYEATGAEEIATAAAVSVGTFYSYFRNKRELLLVLVADRFEQILALGLGDLDLTGPDPAAALAALVGRALAQEGVQVGLRRAWQEAVAGDPELADCDRAVRALLREQIAATIRRGQAAGRLRAALDPAPTALAIMGLVTGLSAWPESADAGVVAAATRMLADTLLAPAAADSP